jgi:diacylglycerol O-acyltransferase-2
MMFVIIDLKPYKILKSLAFLQKPWKIFGIEFAPVFMPIEERISTFVIYLWTHRKLFLALFTSLIMIYMMFLTKYWCIPLAYCGWIFYDKDTMNTGGRSEWITKKIRNWVFWKYFVRYFPIRLVKTANLDDKKNYVIGSHPHGICSAGAFGAFGTEGAGFSSKYPGISPYLHTLDMNCLGPLHREWILGLGCCSSSKRSISHVLSRPGGSASVLVVGGAAESIYSEKGRLQLVLKQRKGFIKMAIRHGADLGKKNI